MFRVRALALAGALAVAAIPGARADWFGMVTLPNRTQLLAEVADTQQIMPGKPFVAKVTQLDGKVETAIYTPTEIMVVGDSISVAAQDQSGNRLTLSLIRRSGKPSPSGSKK